jgi:hypothetical protein
VQVGRRRVGQPRLGSEVRLVGHLLEARLGLACAGRLRFGLDEQAPSSLVEVRGVARAGRFALDLEQASPPLLEVQGLARAVGDLAARSTIARRRSAPEKARSGIAPNEGA